MAAKIGLLAEISGVRRTLSRRKALEPRSNSPANSASGISRRRDSTSSAVRRMRRPLPRPCQGREVREGKAITMFSPRPCWLFTMCFCRPSPKATSNATDTVPQVMPSRVRAVRSFWWRTSWRSARRNESEVSGSLWSRRDRPYSIFLGGRSTTRSFS